MRWTDEVPTLGLLRKIASDFPDNIFIEESDYVLTYRYADRLADALANMLAVEYGVGQGDRVVCASTNGAAFFLIMAAVNRLGAIFVPVAPGRNSNRISQVATDSDPRLILATTQLPDVKIIDAEVQYGIHATNPSCNIFDRKRQVVMRVDPMDEPLMTAGPRTAAATSMLLYTSGSTGKPKGIVISYANQRAAAQSILQYLDLPRHATILTAISPAFDYGLYQYLLALAITGRVITTAQTVLLDDLLSKLSNPDIRVFPTVPTTVRALRNALQGQERTYPAIKVVTSTGSVLDERSVSFLRQAFPSARIYSMYGLTECKRVSYLDPDLLEVKPRSVGRAMPNCEVWILDENGTEAQPGTVGELFVSGPNVANAYWGDAEITAATFRRHPVDGRIVLATGDYFMGDEDGDLYFFGRHDDLVKLNDQRVSLLEVESIVRSLPEVREVVAQTQESNGETQLVVYVDAPSNVSTHELRKAIRNQVPLSAMVPRRIIRANSFKRTDTGKLIRNQDASDTDIVDIDS